MTLRTRRRPRRGVALMLVLWLTVVVGAIAASASATTRAELDVVSNLRAHVTGRYAAESGIAVLTSGIDSMIETAATAEQWSTLFADLDRRLALDSLAVGEGRVAVTVADLSARLDVNRAPASVLTALFAQFAGTSVAARAVAAIRDWRDADDLTRPMGAEADAYDRRGSPFVPTNRPIRRLDELSRIVGIDSALAAAVAPFLTVDGDGRVNINTAEVPVLASLPGVTVAAARSLVARREGGEIFTSADPLRELTTGDDYASFYMLAQLVSPIPSRILVVSRGWMNGHPLTREIQAVYQVESSGLRLRRWRERDR